MKFPPEIWRLAVDCEHLGQTSSGSSEIFWISSHWFWQFVQTYSYVGIGAAQHARGSRPAQDPLSGAAT